jgi:hypothetical protein
VDEDWGGSETSWPFASRFYDLSMQLFTDEDPSGRRRLLKPTWLGMAQVWFTFLLVVMVVDVVVSDGVERRNAAFFAILTLIVLFASTKQKRR